MLFSHLRTQSEWRRHCGSSPCSVLVASLRAAALCASATRPRLCRSLPGPPRRPRKRRLAATPRRRPVRRRRRCASHASGSQQGTPAPHHCHRAHGRLSDLASSRSRPGPTLYSAPTWGRNCRRRAAAGTHRGLGPDPRRTGGAGLNECGAPGAGRADLGFSAAVAFGR
jgi:hypothetical protein